MSLNGLDDPQVAEAYQTALAEAGGWFLLKYVSRDTLEILMRGAGGLAEARGAVVQYEEKSPLYGFLLYRRRKVLIKYIPEETSRLLQVRVAVHFQAITEKFSPHDTIFSITTPDELNDSALISACSLHTAAPSTCSSGGSIRRKKLDEITEDAEEGPSGADDAASLARPTTAASSVLTIGKLSKVDSRSEAASPVTPTVSELQKPIYLLDEVQDMRPASSGRGIDANGGNVGETFSSEYRESLKQYDPLFEHGPDPRLSSQTARPDMAAYYAEIIERYKPKEKLGPRPRPSLENKRPHTSGSGSGKPSARVSTLPTGLRIGNRKTEPKRPKSRDSSIVPSIAFPAPPPVPAVPEIPLSPGFPPASPISVKSMPATNFSNAHKTPGITPEKQRLMKAIELRKKQQKAQKEREERKAKEEATAAESAKTSTGEEGNGQTSAEAENSETTPKEGSPPVAVTKGLGISEATRGAEEGQGTEEVDLSTPELLQEDFSTDIMSSPAETDDQQSAASANSPTSAQTQTPSNAPSTRPSSISDEDHRVFDREEEKAVKAEELDVTFIPQANGIMDSEPSQDHRESAESSPTVVPENDFPTVSAEKHGQSTAHGASDGVSTETDNAVAAHKSRRESMVLPGSTDQVEAREGRTETRNSVIYLPARNPSREPSVHSEASSLRSKSESVAPLGLPRGSFTESREKRRTLEPIKIQLSAENSDAEYLSDDSFMEELKSAKVEEAKPVSVSKSPISPFFPRKNSVAEVNIPERSASGQYRHPGFLTPDQRGGRSPSPSWLQPSSAENVTVAKKINVSSGISQRIKALAEKSNRDSTASVSPTATPETSSSIVAQRKSSFFAAPPDIAPTDQSVKRLNRVSTFNLPTSTSSDYRPISQPINNRQTLNSARREPEKSDSVQVTARIVRDERTQNPRLATPDETTPLELHQSQIVINHQKSTVPNLKWSPVKSNPTSPRPPPSPLSKDASGSNALRSSSETSWRSFGRRMSESKSRASSVSGGQSIRSFESDEDKREGKKEKKDSRASKLFKRMSSISSITSISRKNSAASPPLVEEEDHPSMLPSLREPPSAVQVGDLNVQFPDTLLWKRRFVEIDSSGNLVLSLSKANDRTKGITKRYHLSEFRAPCIPDQDRQELPNSVILDFLDGRTLQCACETPVLQGQVLRLLSQAYEEWLAYGQL